MDLKILGVDLAAKGKNPTGICVMEGSKCILQTSFSDSDILRKVIENSPILIAVDAPLTLGERVCDKLLKKYGVMPLSLKSIYSLAVRAIKIVEKINKLINCKIIEVFPTGTAKVLGVYDKLQYNKIENLKTKLYVSFLKHPTKDELDAFLASLTGFLAINGLTEEIGDEKGKITFPKVNSVVEIIKLVREMNFVLS
jgi:predicted nuclease with RNAse H fold